MNYPIVQAPTALSASRPDVEHASRVAWRWILKRYRDELQTYTGGILRPPHVVMIPRDGSFFDPQTNTVKLGMKRSYWITYEREKIGLTAELGDIERQKLYTITLVHEFTHWMQLLRAWARAKKPHFSELETTRNELVFVSEKWPAILLEALTPFYAPSTRQIALPSKFVVGLIHNCRRRV